jgi:hypothetical protein
VTRDPLDRRTFEALIADLNYPAARLGSLELGGVESWHEAWTRPLFQRPERALVLRQLGDVLLMATPGGLERLQRWRDEETPLPPMAAAERQEWIDWRLSFYGDRSLLPVVLGGLETCPEPVQDTCLREVAWLAVGQESRAWTSSSRFVDRMGREKVRAVLMGPAADERTVRHESAHCWHAPAQSVLPAICAQGEAGVRQLARAEGWYPRLEEHEARAERLADACAWLWTRHEG